MSSALRISLVLGLALWGLPHPLCACGCAGGSSARAVQPTPAPALKCPHCSPGESEPTSEGPTPCDCRGCEQMRAVMPAAPPVAAPASIGGWFYMAVNGPGVQVVLAPTPEVNRGVGPPGFSPSPGSALPILFEHLLL